MRECGNGENKGLELVCASGHRGGDGENKGLELARARSHIYCVTYVIVIVNVVLVVVDACECW